MKIRSVFRENLLIEVFEPEQQIYYKSIIQEVHDDYVDIGIPLRKQKQLDMAENSTWEFRLIVKDTLYYFRSRCLGYQEEEQVTLYRIAWPEKVHRVQRRKFFRLPCSFDAHYWVLKKPWDKEEQIPQMLSVFTTNDGDAKKSAIPGRKPLSLGKLAELMGDPVKALIADISGGGLQLVAPQWMPMGTVLLLGLFLKSKQKEKTFFVKGRIVWVGPHQPKRTVRFRYAVEYMDIPEQIKEEIVRFIFVLMRERML